MEAQGNNTTVPSMPSDARGQREMLIDSRAVVLKDDLEGERIYVCVSSLNHTVYVCETLRDRRNNSLPSSQTPLNTLTHSHTHTYTQTTPDRKLPHVNVFSVQVKLVRSILDYRYKYVICALI